MKRDWEKGIKIKKCIVSGIEKSWYYAFYDGKIYFIFSWNWGFAQPLLLLNFKGLEIVVFSYLTFEGFTIF